MGEDNIVEKAIIEIAKENSKELYYDLAKPGLKNAGNIIGTLTGFFDDVVLYPVKKANLTFKYRLEDFVRELTEKAINIPPEKLIEPPLRITGPVLEGMKYMFDDVDLREMYLNLLTSAMNTDLVDKTHPSFVEVLKQLSPFDAVLFKELYRINTTMPFSEVLFTYGDDYFIHGMPKYFSAEILTIGDPFTISRSIEFINSLSLIQINKGQQVGFNYNNISEHEYIIERFKGHKKQFNKEDLKIKRNDYSILISNYGYDFAEVCIEV